MRTKRFNSYKAYRIGCAVAWAILWIIVAMKGLDQAIQEVHHLIAGRH
ncbi:MAG TPA: hypothetical protein VKG38_14680 [Solirubrobacteraceae bacterium]|nr:hypothetical protein [Solirubrobacteraceae bacterium]